MADFDGRVALVTGGGSGIGAAICRQLAARGASVVVSDLSADAAEDVATEITDSGGTAIGFEQDVGDPAQCEAAVGIAIDTFGGLHLAVNNAGIAPRPSPVGEMDVEDWRRVMRVNLDGVFYGLRFQIPGLEGSGGGAIVNISSILGTTATTNAASYIAAKHGVVGLTKAAALEYATQGIRVNAVGPGYIRTPLLENVPQTALDHVIGLHPVARLGTADEVAALTVFLLSDAASFITGSYHLVDGGYTAQ